jgi:multidrug efflux pump subunit AcrB
VPTQDKQYLVAFAQLPDGASLDRTDAVMRTMAEIGLKVPGSRTRCNSPALSISGFSVAPNAGIIFIGLKPFEERKAPNLSGPAIAGRLNAQFSQHPGSLRAHRPPPPVNGLGTIGGFKLFVEDRAGLGYDALFQNTQALIGKGYALRTPISPALLDLHGQRAAARCGDRPGEGQEPGRAAAESLRDDAGLSRIAVRE